LHHLIYVAGTAIQERRDDGWISQQATLLEACDEGACALVIVTFMFQQVTYLEQYQARDSLERIVHFLENPNSLMI